jgi:hypothetical protein
MIATEKAAAASAATAADDAPPPLQRRANLAWQRDRMASERQAEEGDPDGEGTPYMNASVVERIMAEDAETAGNAGNDGDDGENGVAPTFEELFLSGDAAADDDDNGTDGPNGDNVGGYVFSMGFDDDDSAEEVDNSDLYASAEAVAAVLKEGASTNPATGAPPDAAPAAPRVRATGAPPDAAPPRVLSAPTPAHSASAPAPAPVSARTSAPAPAPTSAPGTSAPGSTALAGDGSIQNLHGAIKRYCALYMCSVFARGVLWVHCGAGCCIRVLRSHASCFVGYF